MYVGMARLTVVVGQSHSLKEKRMAVRRIKDRVRERVGVVVNEVGELDNWQRAELGCAVVSVERQRALELLDEVVRVTAAAAVASDAQLMAVAKDAWTFDAPSAPLPAIDERTGAGDKAAGATGDDWLPDEWRDDLDR
ncbi:MAG: DUF503 family protein [Kofleriaceae bacterium]